MNFAPTILRGEIVSPHLAPEDTRLPDTPLTQGSGDPFTAAFFNTWSFVEGDHVEGGQEWLPDYREIRHVSGANGCSDAGGGRVNPNAALHGAMNKGAIPIRNGDPRMGVYAKYLARHVKRRNHGGASPFVYCLAPVEWVILANGTEAVPEHTAETKAWLVGFRRQMYIGGLIPPMAQQQLATHLNRQSQRVQRWTEALERGHLTQPAYDSRVAEASRLRQAMQDTWQRQFSAAYRAQIASAPPIKAQVVNPEADADLEGLGTLAPAAPVTAEDTEKIAAVRRAGIAEAQRTPEEIAEVKAALSMKADTPLERFGLTRLAEYADHLEGL